MENKSKTQERVKIILLSILIGAVLLMLNYTSLGKQAKNAFFLISSPIQSLFWKQGQGIGYMLETIQGMTDLEKKNQELNLQNQELKAEIAGLKTLKDENEDLRKLLGLGLEKDFRLIMAEAIAKNPLEDSLLIDKGSESGISLGFPIISPEKILIGRVEEVFPNFSRVSLVSNKKISLSAEIQGKEEKITGISKGEGNLKIVFDLIPQDKKIEKGDLVVTTALGGGFPKGFLIGEIASTDYSDVKPFQTAQIKPAFELKDLNSLFVITNLK
jgi:rod shape-determining protein MreC